MKEVHTTQTPFEVFNLVYDEFEKQSRGKLTVSKVHDIFAIMEVSVSPSKLMEYVEQWMKEFKSKPELVFYRNNFFWKVGISDKKLYAILVEKGTKRFLPLDVKLSWPISIVNPSKVVKNLLDIMKKHEEKLKERKQIKVR